MKKAAYWFFLIGILSVIGCQRVQLAEYRKYESVAAVPRISVEEAKKDVDAGIAIIVDSRAESAYNAEHIAGSIRLPSGSADDKFTAISKGKKVIVYCSCASEGTSSSLAFQMNQKGIANTYAMVGGTHAWQTAGYPMEKSQ